MFFMRIRITDRVIGLIFLLIAIFGFSITLSFQKHDVYTYGESIFVAPSFYPRVLLITLAVLAVFLIMRSHFVDSSQSIQWTKEDMLRVFLIYLCFLLYPFFLPRIGDPFIRPGMGFIITSGFFLVFLMIGLGARRYFWVFLSSFAVIGSVYLFFVLLLKIMLP